MKRNFPKLIALSLIISLSITYCKRREQFKYQSKDKKHVQVNVEDKVFLLTYVI